MWKNNRVAQALGIEFPIVQGPFGGGISSVALASAVSNAGGLGSFGAHMLGPQQILETAADIRKHTQRPFALNLWVPKADELIAPTEAEFEAAVRRLAPYYESLGTALPKLSDYKMPRFEDQAAAILEARPAAFSFIYGIPSPEILAECRRRGIVTLGCATNVEEAKALEAAGVNIIVASGAEAGGHRASFLGDPLESPSISALVPQVADSVKVPVVAAGGIADGRGFLSALVLGASGVQVGTAFLACEESNASAAHREALRRESARYTALTRVFSGRYARGIKNTFMSEMRPFENEVPRYPLQNWLTGSIRSAAAKMGRAELMGLWAGQNAPLVRHNKASDVVRYLVEGAEAARSSIGRL